MKYDLVSGEKIELKQRFFKATKVANTFTNLQSFTNPEFSLSPKNKNIPQYTYIKFQ